jgi:peroxiredoxin
MVSTTDTNHATIAERVAQLQQGVAVPGEPMPDAQLLDVHGAPTTLAKATGGRSSVVVLYRGAWCPYCNLTLRAYQEDLVPQLAQRDIPLLAISPQKPDGSLSMQEKNELTFTVLSDPGNQIAAALGVLTAPTDDARDAQRTIGLDLAESNADGTQGVPMPTVAIVDSKGIIRWIDVHPDYTTRTEVADIIDAVSAWV